MVQKIRNICSGLSGDKKREVFQVLKKGRGFKIERIVSRGQSTPPGKWLRSRRAEWVMVARGRARLSFYRDPKPVRLKEGDHVFIPAGTRHRVDWTSPRQRTVWLAVHIG